MNFNLLANELILEIFEYLSGSDVLLNFYNLNKRVNKLIFYYFQTHTLHFKSISKTNLIDICEYYLPSIKNKITSIHLTDDDDTPTQIDLFLTYNLSLKEFSCLSFLSIHRIYSSKSLINILQQLIYLPNLTYLKIIRHTIIYNESYDIDVIRHIEHLPKLTHLYLDITNSNEDEFLIPSIQCFSLKFLSLPYLDCTVNQLIHLIKYLPDIQYLRVRIVDHSIVSSLVPIKFSKIQKFKFTFYGTLNALNYLLSIVPNVEELKIEIESIYIDGYQWQKLLENNSLNLIRFQFKMSISLSNEKIKENIIDEMLNSFRHQFWIEKHQWFVQCHWNSMETSSLVYVYTLPFAFKHIFYMGNICLKSTNQKQNQIYSFNNVQNLLYSHNQDQNFDKSNVYFNKINYLDLTIPFDDRLWSIMSKFDQLNTLKLVLFDDMSNVDQSKLQNLFDRLHNLRSLSFFSWSNKNLFPLNLILPSLSIQKLDLRAPNLFFNYQQCQDLVNSSIIQQCQVLLINIQYHSNIIDLIEKLKNLRTLVVHTMQLKTIPNNEDYIMEWLRNNLPETCSIAVSIETHICVRLWIK